MATSARTTFDRIIAVLAWAAVLTQFVLALLDRQVGVGEMLIRFFSYFTVLTNTLVAAYFTERLRGGRSFLTRPGAITAVTAFITVVGSVYQVVLRSTWSPTGVHMVVDELLHTIVPLLVVVYYFRFSTPEDHRLRPVLPWLFYPLMYFGAVILRGSVGGFYPYPFVDVSTLGYPSVFLNFLLLTLLALTLIGALIGAGRWRDRRRGAAAV